jgi:hypothetical protein
MRVKISYAVSAEEIIGEVCRLLSKISVNLAAGNSSLEKNIPYLADNTIREVLIDIDTLRKELAKNDQSLEDCSAILQGYLGLLEQPPATQEQGEHNANNEEPEVG